MSADRWKEPDESRYRNDEEDQPSTTYATCLDCGAPVLKVEYGGSGVCTQCGLGFDE